MIDLFAAAGAGAARAAVAAWGTGASAFALHDDGICWWLVEGWSVSFVFWDELKHHHILLYYIIYQQHFEHLAQNI